MKTPAPHRLLPALLALAAAIMPGSATADASPPRLKAYHTRLPFDDHGFTGRQFPQFAELAVTKQFKTTMVFSGLIDEVKLFDMPPGSPTSLHRN